MEAAEQSLAMMSAQVMKKESSIDIPEEIRQKMSLDISTMISDAIDNKARAFGSKR